MQISGAREKSLSRADIHIIDLETIVVKHGDFGRAERIAATKVVVQNHLCARHH